MSISGTIRSDPIVPDITIESLLSNIIKTNTLGPQLLPTNCTACITKGVHLEQKRRRKRVYYIVNREGGGECQGGCIISQEEGGRRLGEGRRSLSNCSEITTSMPVTLTRTSCQVQQLMTDFHTHKYSSFIINRRLGWEWLCDVCR